MRTARLLLRQTVRDALTYWWFWVGIYGGVALCAFTGRF